MSNPYGAPRRDRAAREVLDDVAARGGAEGIAKELSDNVEASARVYEQTYDAALNRGENAVEAGGDAYDAVLGTLAERAEQAR